ncbi:PTS sugar transporter subunit IIA [Chromatium weissei]|nr:PTS sugar transporter subunit IIA [Chromatium weissei]
MLSIDLIDETRVICGLEITSKKRLLEILARLLASAHPRLNAEVVFERLLERERLGSTALGHGIALPHARTKDVTEVIGALVQLQRGIDYDGMNDDEPVDLAFALLAPEEANDQHLRLLAQLAGRFSDPTIRDGLRQAESPAALLQVLNISSSS